MEGEGEERKAAGSVSQHAGLSQGEGSPQAGVVRPYLSLHNPGISSLFLSSVTSLSHAPYAGTVTASPLPQVCIGLVGAFASLSSWTGSVIPLLPQDIKSFRGTSTLLLWLWPVTGTPPPLCLPS